jgi:hypothetical protein
MGTVLRCQYELVSKNDTMELTGVIVRDWRAHRDATNPHDPVFKLLQNAADVILMIRNAGTVCGKNEKHDHRHTTLRFHL